MMINGKEYEVIKIIKRRWLDDLFVCLRHCSDEWGYNRSYKECFQRIDFLTVNKNILWEVSNAN